VADVARRAGAIDVALNATGVTAVQRVPLLDLPVPDVMSPVTAWTSSQLITATAVARHMQQRGQGVILTVSAPPAKLAIADTGGFGVACAAVEALSRTLPAELGPRASESSAFARTESKTHSTHPTYQCPWPSSLPGFPQQHDCAQAPADPGRGNRRGSLPHLPQNAAAMSATVVNTTCGTSVD
jgi:hypothetical protein